MHLGAVEALPHLLVNQNHSFRRYPGLPWFLPRALSEQRPVLRSPATPRSSDRPTLKHQPSTRLISVTLY